MKIGQLTNISRMTSLEWCLIHCHFVSKKDTEQFVKNYKTHGATLLCGHCNQSPYIKLNLPTETVECILCKNENRIC